VARATRHRFILLGERLLRGKERPTTLFTFDPDPSGSPSTTAAATSHPQRTAEPAR